MEVLGAIFVAEPHLGRINRHQAYKFQIHARGEVVQLLNHLMPRSRNCEKRVAEETGLLRGILKYAACLQNGTARIYAETHFACLALVCSAAASEKADLWALKGDLYEVIGHVLANVKSWEQVDLARRLLCATMKADLEDNILSQYPSIGSSLLAMRSAGDRMGAETWDCVVNHAVRQFWREELQDLSSKGAESYLDERFRADEKAVRRAVQLGKMFSAPSEETCQTFYVEKPRSKQRTAETEPAEVGAVGAASVPVKPRLERRKCSHSSCGNVESMGGTFQICGRCRLAVYCSKACQKLAWRTGHKDFCH
ncbi:hypothetical protein KFL_001850050 [Klebsormidium nitens]|uniref:MYND-type domain-containing protein n=1 Tax=Klebsormidium nitens TaxID=105231 RepID=A0A1Y1I069_KLENI|nr:hypothetical protein KFL_001850050 [Klebsormidium nitens]|eukprot:GAQ84330.1 hypothetical protein KFL_001850050 [Klebsormidium nitens]